MANELGIPGLAGMKEIGRGGTGVVYRCQHVASRREVAVNVLDQIVLDDEEAATFKHDFAALADATDDPLLVTILAIGVLPSGNPYLVVDYVDGGSLAAITSTGTLDPDVAASILAEVCGAVERLHQRGMVHGDITPSNVLLTADGEPRLSGFGIAQYFSAGRHSAALSVSPVHGAPEVLAGRDRGAGSDVWALASVLMDTVCRSSPFGFGGAPGAELVAAALRGDEADYSSAPYGLRPILGAALVLDPSLRCSAGQLASSLRTVAGPRLDTTAGVLVEPSIAISTTPRGRIRVIPRNEGIFANSAPPPARRRVLGAVAALVIVFGLFVAAVATGPTEDPIDNLATESSSTVIPAVGPSTSVAATSSTDDTSERASETFAPIPTTRPAPTTTRAQQASTVTAAASTTTSTTDPEATTTTDPDATTTPDDSTTTTDPDASSTTTTSTPDSTTTVAESTTTTVAETTTTTAAVTTTTVAETTTTTAAVTTTTTSAGG
jgi:serine/threonine protein kinase